MQRIKKRGFTLIEVLVAVSIFAILVASSTGAFIFAIRAQQSTIAQQELVDNTRFSLEFISRLLRVAKRDDGVGCIAAGTTYATNATNDEVRFISSKDKCIRIFFDVDRIRMENITDSPGVFTDITAPGAVNVSSLRFSLLGVSSGDSEQPRVTMAVVAQKNNVAVELQTSVSQRNLDVP